MTVTGFSHTKGHARVISLFMPHPPPPHPLLYLEQVGCIPPSVDWHPSVSDLRRIQLQMTSCGCQIYKYVPQNPSINAFSQ